MARAWWDSAVETVDDLFNGTLTLKARHAREIEFCKLAVQPLQSPVRISVIMTCYRFAQRLRLALMGWGHQDVPSGTLEVIVVNPESPDGTHELIAAMAAAYPEVRLRELPVPQSMWRNKGWMLNRAIEASRGDWVWLTDADCIFPSGAAAALLADVEKEASLLYGERRHLAKSATDELLAGRRSPVTDFARLAEAAEGGAIDLHPWGYTQIVHRSQLSRVRYREDLDHFSGSDGAFLENCRSAGLAERRCAGLTCLHLSHPFAWNGTKLFL
jgi:glycosyltransferase involved in cell wall biosynthesis